MILIVLLLLHFEINCGRLWNTSPVISVCNSERIAEIVLSIFAKVNLKIQVAEFLWLSAVLKPLNDRPTLCNVAGDVVGVAIGSFISGVVLTTAVFAFYFYR